MYGVIIKYHKRCTNQMTPEFEGEEEAISHCGNQEKMAFTT